MSLQSLISKSEEYVAALKKELYEENTQKQVTNVLDSTPLTETPAPSAAPELPQTPIQDIKPVTIASVAQEPEVVVGEVKKVGLWDKLPDGLKRVFHTFWQVGIPVLVAQLGLATSSADVKAAFILAGATGLAAVKGLLVSATSYGN